MADLKLWKFTDPLGPAVYCREEDFRGLQTYICAKDECDHSSCAYWSVVTPDETYQICNADAERLAGYLSTFVVADFTTDEVQPEQLGRWKVS